MKENKEVSHVLGTIELGCVDLTSDQFPDKANRVPSLITISSPVKAFSNENANPPIV